jgi:expansin (peptidoglycan-binding protein)
MRFFLFLLTVSAFSAGCSSSHDGGSSSGGPDPVKLTPGGPVVPFGQSYEGGQYNLGPVDYSESQWHNACAPQGKYDSRVSTVEGTPLAGIWNGIPNVASYCDACIFVETPKGKSAMFRVVTYGDTSSNSIDVSQDGYDALSTGEYPRTMTWRFAKCPDTGPMLYEFQTGSNQWWTSLWVRNPRVPIAKVEVQSANHKDWSELMRQSDGTLMDGGGFGKGPFSIRSTGVDGQQVVDSFDWPSPDIAGAFLTGKANFK